MRSIATTSSTRFLIWSLVMPCDSSGNAMFCRTLICGYRAKNWKTNAMSRCDAVSQVTSLPSM